MIHTVRLPHPDRECWTYATCACGWSVRYEWGGHGDAADLAAKHIEETTESEPLEAVEMSGTRTVMPGRSL